MGLSQRVRVYVACNKDTSRRKRRCRNHLSSAGMCNSEVFALAKGLLFTCAMTGYLLCTWPRGANPSASRGYLYRLPRKALHRPARS